MKRTSLVLFLFLAIGLACSQRELKTCDITQRVCQEDVYYRLLSLRGDGYDPFGGLPPVTVITEDQYRQMLIKEAADAGKQGPSPWDTALSLLHFTTNTSTADAGADAGGSSATIEDEATHVYAFYIPTTKKITVVSHPTQGDEYEKENAMVTLAHELVHALQDRELDLQKDDFKTSDEYFCYSAIIEGDARFYENLFINDMRQMLGMSPRDPVMVTDTELNDIYENFQAVGTSLFVARLLAYPLGAKYIATKYASGGNAAIRHGYATMPRHTVGLLVGSDGRVPKVSDGEVCEAPAVSSLPTSGDTAGADQFGALLFYAFLRGWDVNHDTAFSTAQTWTGDFLRLQASTDLKTTAVAWRIEFSSPPPAGIATTLTTSGKLTATSDSKSLQITTSDSATPLTWKATGNCP
jgi:hypothetical protein